MTSKNSIPIDWSKKYSDNWHKMRTANMGIPAEPESLKKIKEYVRAIIDLDSKENNSSIDYSSLVDLCEKIIRASKYITISKIGPAIKQITTNYESKLLNKENREKELTDLKEILTFSIP
ncbi:MAG: hypothetical protein ACP5N2_05940 [Candidatus Nanoarchaeia archaeon]